MKANIARRAAFTIPRAVTIAVLLLAALPGGSAAITAGITQVTWVGSPTPYAIEITDFKTPLPKETLEAEGTFQLEADDQDRTGLIKDVTPAGIEVEGGYTKAWLWGDFDPYESYTATITYADASTDECSVKGITPEPEPSVPIFVSIFKEADLKLDIFVPEDVEALGFDYNFAWEPLPFHLFSSATENHTLDVELRSDGELSTDKGAENLQTNLRGSAEMVYFFAYRIRDVKLAGRKRTLPYSAQARLALPKAEATQDLKIVDLLVEAKIEADIPIIFDVLGLSWQAATGTNVPFLPPYFYAGFAYMAKAGQPEGQAEREKLNRVEFGAGWDFAVSWHFNISPRYKAVYVIDGEEYEYYWDLRAKYYPIVKDVTQPNPAGLNKRRVPFAMEFGYQKGELPPAFRSTQTYLAGFSAEVF